MGLVYLMEGAGPMSISLITSIGEPSAIHRHSPSPTDVRTHHGLLAKERQRGSGARVTLATGCHD